VVWVAWRGGEGLSERCVIAWKADAICCDIATYRGAGAGRYGCACGAVETVCACAGARVSVCV